MSMTATERRLKRSERQKEIALKAHDQFMVSGSDALSDINLRSRERFIGIGFPRRGDEAFTYVDTAALEIPTELPVESARTAQALGNVATLPDVSLLYLIDGRMEERLCDIGRIDAMITVDSLSTAPGAYPDSAMKNMAERMEREEDPYALLGYAFLRSAQRVTIADNATLTEPLQVIMETHGKGGALNSSALRIDVGAHAVATIVLSAINHSSAETPLFHHTAIDLRVAVGARLTLIYDEVDGDMISFTSFATEQGEGSAVDFFSFTSGGPLSRISYDWRLGAENAAVTFRSLAMVNGRNQAHTYARFHHAAPNCSSDLLFRNALTGVAGRTSVDATVEVWPGATKSVSKQLINNLVLSEGGRADCKPNLVIRNDDVDCSHGATLGALDFDQLLYLRSRGFTEGEARRLLLRAFAAQVIDAVPFRPVRERMRERLTQESGE